MGAESVKSEKMKISTLLLGGKKSLGTDEVLGSPSETVNNGF